jgi:Tfp pilus assembly protein PilF
MIARNEEEYIERCIRSARQAVEELILVDTGSEDETADRARRLGATVYHHAWNDDFSDARNVSLKHASGDWILVLDADEVLSPENIPTIRRLAGGQADGYLFTYRSYSRESADIRWVANDGARPEADGWDGWIPGRVVRMFRRDPRIRFEGIVHETVESAIGRFGGTIQETDVLIHHFHETKGREKLREKQLHYLRLCEKHLARYPGNAKIHFDMGLIYRHILGDLPRAITHQKKALELNPSFEDARLELAISYHLRGESKSAAAEATTLLQHNPDCAPALLLCGIMLEHRGKPGRALDCYERGIALNPNLIDARINLGALLCRRGDFARARTEWQRARELNPSNTRVLLNLGALALRDGNHDSARRFFREALDYTPDNALLWNNMGALHASQGRDQDALAAFEKALELDPSCGDARRNAAAVSNRAGAEV